MASEFRLTGRRPVPILARVTSAFDGHVRATWDELPEPVRAGIEDLLGARVISAVTQAGGFSPGLAARMRCADGSRAFVKAVGPELNPHTPRLHRAEIAVVGSLPAAAPVPALRGSYDDGDWVALVFDEVDGVMPGTPWSAADLDRAVAAVTELSESLTPCPVPGARLVADTLRADMNAYARLAEGPPDDLLDWEAGHLAELAEAGTGALRVMGGDTLVHIDLRADNILFGADAVWFVDWAWASRGPVWLDSLLLMLDVAANGQDPERYLDRHRLFAGVDPWAVTSVLIGAAGMWAEACRQPPPPGIPTVREYQRARNATTVDWIRRRTGWE